MRTEERIAIALELCLRSNSLAKPSEAFVRNSLDDALGGALVMVTWRNGIENGFVDSYVFFDRENRPTFFSNSVEMMRFLSTRAPRATSIPWFRDAIAVASVPGLIAVVVTMTICYLAAVGGSDPPQILGHALSIILGFYFGSNVSHNSDQTARAINRAAVQSTSDE